MAYFRVADPRDGASVGLEAETARLLQELNEITALGDAQACRLCGEQAKLTAD